MVVKKINIENSRAGEPANFLAAPAPAPGIFFERLRLQGAKNTRLRLLGKIFFSPQIM